MGCPLVGFLHFSKPSPHPYCISQIYYKGDVEALEYVLFLLKGAHLHFYKTDYFSYII